MTAVDRLLTVEQLADMLQVPVGTVYRWNYAGGGPPALRIGKHRRYDPRDVAEWLRECREPTSVSGRRRVRSGARDRERVPNGRRPERPSLAPDLRSTTTGGGE